MSCHAGNLETNKNWTLSFQQKPCCRWAGLSNGVTFCEVVPHSAHPCISAYFELGENTVKSILVRRVASAMALGPVWLGAVLAISVGEAQAQAATGAALVELGKRVFFDPISHPRGRQACASCHDPSAGWTSPSAIVNSTTVAVPGAAFHAFLGFRGRFGRFDAIGTLKPPSSAYATLVPRLQAADCGAGPFVPDVCGGVFWNGRASGEGGRLPDEAGVPSAWAITDTITRAEVFTVNGEYRDDLQDAYAKHLGPVAEQALNPFVNDVEQNNPDREAVCNHVQRAPYAKLYEHAWLEPINCDASEGVNPRPVDISYKRIAVALAAYEGSESESNQFTSKRDLALRNDGSFPLAGFSDLENYGHDLFYAVSLPPNPNPVPVGTKTGCSDVPLTTEEKAANCVVCHNSARPSLTPDLEKKQTYADFNYHNIGIPLNPQIPNNPGANPGLNGVTGDPQHLGLFRTATLRNVDKRPYPGFVKAYGHNGWFKSLESIVHFYNTGFIPDGDAYASSTAAAFHITRCSSDKITEKEAKRLNCWPKPENPGTTALGAVIGDLKLNSCDEKAIVAYMKTLSDTKPVRRPGPYRPGSIPR
ncbi:cytochrome-c peroxidase [Methylotetracoccus oryzae]|uniref:cytochrome-c peroxidase n=1 Tax=Methylotetracoccus oryzae TaxID=1919059 RepID=UPI0011188B9B|nr:cytochrome c peroxidase [Methylotetracoccus oryzae]